ncbi:MAG: hypothetical protein OHK0029_04530 [Armatimonadaceae bacterium]
MGILGALAMLPITGLSATAQEPLTVLTVGGGPQPKMNQVAIESNVRYVDGLLPANARKRILFADGKTTTPHVLYMQPEPAAGDTETAYRVVMEGSRTGSQRYRRPELPTIDGPAELPTLREEFERIAGQSSGPILLYFTGHGERNRNLNNNLFNLWMGTPPEETGPVDAERMRELQAQSQAQSQAAPRQSSFLSVRELANQIKLLPENRPVTLVMVQCYSGSFANLLFEDGNPDSPLVNRPICGFFATTSDRPAAGCTPEINEADYQDFTSYFFAALAGKDRSGKPVSATDYDGNGTIGMEEAYIYALINEPSIDVPVVTSDQFLRRFVSMNDDEIAALPFSKIRAMASPARRAAMDALSKSLGTDAEDRLKQALFDYRSRLDESAGHGLQTTSERDATNFLIAQRQKLFQQFPELEKAKNMNEYLEVRKKIVASLQNQPELVKQVLESDETISRQRDRQYADELRGARWLRLFRIAKTVVLENKLRQSGDQNRIAQFNRLRELEQRNPLQAQSVAASPFAGATTQTVH